MGTTTVPAPVLKLRGGLAGLDGNQVATYASWLLAANSAVMTLAPEKAVEMYGVKSSSMVVSQFVEYAGSSMLSIAIASILALGGMDFATAVAWGFVPQCVLNVQGFLNDKMTKMGFGQAAKFMPTIVSLVLTAGLFGKLSFLDTAMALKIAAGWSAINGLGGYFATADFMKAWEGPTMTPVETAMAKFFCGTLIMGGVFAGSVAFLDSDVLTAIPHLGGLPCDPARCQLHLQDHRDHRRGQEPAVRVDGRHGGRRRLHPRLKGEPPPVAQVDRLREECCIQMMAWEDRSEV